MSLSIPPASSNSLVDTSTFVTTAASALASSASPFIDAVADLTAVNFSTIGDLSFLGYSFNDLTADLAALQALAPDPIESSDSRINADIDAITGLAVPAVPAITTPTSTFPTLEAARPDLLFPDRPGTDLPDAPTDAPAITDLALPDAPTVALPDAPTFDQLQLPAAPSISIPSFTDSTPVNNLAPPTQQFSYVDAGYTSSLRDPLIAKLLYDLENGGYGIDVNDEQALWTRARDRAEAQARAELEEVVKRASAMSFPMPQGAMFAEMDRARANVLKAASEANREIFIKRADQFVENRKFTITEVREFEQISISLYNAVQERSLNAAKATVELGIAVFDSTVRNFTSQLEAFKAGAQVFEARIRAELAKTEVYKSQIDAERLRGDFNKTQVEVYTARLRGIQTVVDIYKSRVEAVNLLAQVQAQRIEIFKSRVQAYSIRVQAKASEYEMFKAAIAGETAKLEVYKTDVSVFETKVKAEESRVRTLLLGNESLIQRYKASVDQYQAQLGGLTKKGELQVESDRNSIFAQTANVSLFKALTDSAHATTTARIESAKVNNAWNIAALNSRVEVVKFRLEELKATYGFREKIDEFGARLFMDPLSATLASLSGLSVKTE